MGKKFACVIIAVIMALSIMSVAAFAAEDHNIMLTSQRPGAEIQGQGITWIKEESYDFGLARDESVWYGLDNGNGVFPDGSDNFVKLTVNHLDAPLLIAEEAPFVASVWAHLQPVVIIAVVLIIAIIVVILIKKKNESK